MEKLKIIYMSPDSLTPNSWNSNETTPESQEKLEESLRRNGAFEPIIVREVNGTYEVIGGWHRTLAAKKLGMSEIPVAVLKNISDAKAKEMGLASNARYGVDDNYRLSEILNSLEDPSLASYLLPHHTDADLESLLLATHIDTDLMMDIDDTDDLEVEETPISAAPKTHTIMRFKVPLEDSEKIEALIKSTMRIHGFKESDELTNAGDALVHLLLNNGSVKNG